MLRVGIAGAAHPHVGIALQEIRRREDVALVAAAEPDAHLASLYLAGLDSVSREEAAVVERDDIDLVIVAGRYDRRPRVIVDALHAGKSVLADKPLCQNEAELAAIKAAACTNPHAHLSTVFDKRWYFETEHLMKVLADGVLGTPCQWNSTGPHRLNPSGRPAWFVDPDLYGHIAADLPTHDLDLFLMIADAPAGEVTGHAGRARTDTHPDYLDHVALLIRAGSMMGTIDANWLEPDASLVHGRYQARLTGSEGVAEVNWAEHSLTVTGRHQSRTTVTFPAQDRPLRRYFDQVVAGDRPDVDTHQSLLVAEAAVAARDSCMLGGTKGFGA